ncbi:AcrR family transcriptional regulator [Kitasatospora sp. MAA4]|uniref:TetR/AcrR family transcriptional regulator C-terminal domain-containing protein n=1 Tax=Kitasatospora sp. MAA4 TaxID=3035093 RepID=UPI002474649A|nr:TetR/AcrR family transcriptional regulator C-terminal domain-containing protein [Kitasatospora sp. MAA4]MDH6137107.1 AcrR family transcriptional regulator [Kitasatospora sp. MAA4]
MTNRSAEPARRTGDRGRYGRLSRSRVLKTAFDLVDREGLSALSMRKVAAELDVEAMSLYRYANGKDALLDGLVEVLYEHIEQELAHCAPPPATDWQAGLQRIVRATYQVALSHPQMAPLLATRILAVPMARRPQAVLRTHEQVLTLLEQSGLDRQSAVHAYRAVTAWTLGFILTDLQAMVDDPTAPEIGFRLGLQHMSAQETPALRTAAERLAEPGGTLALETGLAALLASYSPTDR